MNIDVRHSDTKLNNRHDLSSRYIGELAVLCMLILASTMSGCGGCHRIDENSERLKDLPESREALRRLQADGKYGLAMPKSEHVIADDKVENSDTQKAAAKDSTKDSTKAVETANQKPAVAVESVPPNINYPSAIRDKSAQAALNDTQVEAAPAPPPPKLAPPKLASADLTAPDGDQLAKAAPIQKTQGEASEEVSDKEDSSTAGSDDTKITSTDEKTVDQAVDNTGVIQDAVSDEDVNVTPEASRAQKNTPLKASAEAIAEAKTDTSDTVPKSETQQDTVAEELCSPGSTGSKGDQAGDCADSVANQLETADDKKVAVKKESDQHLSRPWPINLGVVVSRKVDVNGAVVERVIEGGLGETIGIKAGDLLLEIDDVNIHSADDLRWSLLKKTDTLDIIVERKHTKVRLRMDMFQNDHLYL